MNHYHYELYTFVLAEMLIAYVAEQKIGGIQGEAFAVRASDARPGMKIHKLTSSTGRQSVEITYNMEKERFEVTGLSGKALHANLVGLLEGKGYQLDGKMVFKDCTVDDVFEDLKGVMDSGQPTK